MLFLMLRDRHEVTAESSIDRNRPSQFFRRMKTNVIVERVKSAPGISMRAFHAIG